MDMQEILARLDAGETADAIAAEMANALNAAQKAKADREAASANREENLNELAQHMLDAINDYLFAAYDVEPVEIPVADLREIIDDVGPILHSLQGAKVSIEKLNVPAGRSKAKKVTATKRERTADDVIADFFKSMGW